MKISAIILLLLIPIVAFAQNYQDMSEEDMQKMTQQMQKMETCMQNIDQAKLKVLEQRTYQFEAEVRSLCDSGKREEAQAKTISFGKEIANDPTMQAMRKCRKMMKGMLPKMPYMDQHKDSSNRHVCDQVADNKEEITIERSGHNKSIKLTAIPAVQFPCFARLQLISNITDTCYK